MNTRPTYTVAQTLAQTVQARLNCIEKHNQEWKEKHEDLILQVVRNYMPSGSGIDNGTKIDLDKSTGDRLVFTFGFHHMHESGMYDGWTEHTIVVRPAFIGLDLRITGRDRNQVKEYLYDTYDCALSAVVDRDEQTAVAG